MNKVAILRVPFKEIIESPEFGALASAYAAESSVPGMRHGDIQSDLYLKLEAAGMLHSFGAWDGDKLVGFLGFSVSMLHNYGVTCASVSFYFVSEPARETGAGLRLLKIAESWAVDIGAEGFIIGCPSDGRLSAVLPKIGYTEPNRLFFKALK